jgi:xanthine dehydrogenase molybdenum-binding subunit
VLPGIESGRPVKLTLTREEDCTTIHATHSHDLKFAAKKDGTLIGAKMQVISDIGAHIIQGYSFLGVCCGWMASLYQFKNISYKGIAVYTNKAPSCAMQGFGNPQVTFAVESLIDDLAEKLGMDPLELTLKNYVGLGKPFWGQGPQVRSVVLRDGVARR